MLEGIYDARMDGKAVPGAREGEWLVDYSSTCKDPIRIRRHSDSGALMADYFVPCRKCERCLRARMGRWAYRAIAETRKSMQEGRRTWFGTLTLKPEAMASTLLQAQEAYGSAHEDWWSDPLCDFRFELHRQVLLGELQKYWKRLRKSGLEFKYFCTFEKHKSGLPHIHWLLHEIGAPIRKRKLQDQWHHGFTKIKIVGGYCRKRRRFLKPEWAAFYVAKYLQKQHQPGRLPASVGYGKPSSS